MAGLLEKIKDLYPDQARELEEADFRSDHDIRTLTREDLHELLGPKLKQRKAIYELIHQQKPIGDLIKDLKAFIPAESLEAALADNGVLSGYLQIMKDLTSQVGKVQSFLQEHVSLLEEHSYKAAKVPRTGSKAQKGSNLPPTPTGTHPGSNVQKGSNRPPTQTGFGQAKVVPSSSSPESGQRDGSDLRSDTDPDPHPSNVDPDEPLGAHKAQPVAEVSSSVSTEQMRKTEMARKGNAQEVSNLATTPTGTHPGSNAQKDSNLPPAGIGGIIALKLYFSFTTIVLLCCEVDLRENFQKDLEMA